MSDLISPRVNSRHMPEFLGRTVRLACKVLNFQGDTAIVEASDGGQIEVQLTKDHTVTSTCVEIIGTVTSESSMKMQGCINMQSDLDMKLVDKVIEMTFRPQFAKIFFPQS